MKVVLVTAPSFDPYTENVSKASLEMLAGCGIEIESTILQEENATKRKFIESIAESKPDLILINGHGLPEKVEGHQGEILISTQDEDLDTYSGTIIYAISCETALDLADVLIENNVKAYIGYTDEFGICVDSSDDTILKFYLDPANELSLQLLKNRTVEESLVSAKEAFEKSLQRMYGSTNPIISNSRNLMLAPLYKNYSSLVAKGEMNAKI
jgi:hypothetical protein